MGIILPYPYAFVAWTWEVAVFTLQCCMSGELGIHDYWCKDVTSQGEIVCLVLC